MSCVCWNLILFSTEKMHAYTTNVVHNSCTMRVNMNTRAKK
jgi:hypothetical protein